MNINKNEETAAGNFAPGGTINPGKIHGIVIHPEAADFLTFAQTDDIKTNGQAALVTDAYGSRSFFIHKLGQPTNNGEGVAYETRDQLKTKTDPGTKDMTYMLTSGMWADHKKLLNFEGRAGQYRCIFVDENGVLWGLRSSTGFIGCRLHALEAQPWEEAVTGQAARYWLRIALKDINEWNNLVFVKKLDFNPFIDSPGVGWAGVKDVYLADETPGSASAGVFEVTATLHDGEVNLVEQFYDSGKWGQATAWDCKLADGTAITVSSVAIVSEAGKRVRFRLTLDTADSEYDAGVTAYISLKPISTLAGVGIVTKYYESNRLAIELS